MSIRILAWRVIKLLIRLLFPDIQQLSTRDLAAWLEQEDAEKPLLLDARTEEEYNVSHLQYARLVPSRLEALNNNVKLTTPLVVYCSVGYRSSAIARQLQSMGYENVFNLSGSIFEWINENRSVYSGGKRVDRVHPYQKLWKFLLIDH